MKLLVCTSIVAVLVVNGYAQMPRQLLKYPAKLTIKVKTDEYKPVGNVTVGVSTFDHWVPGEGFGKDSHTTRTAITDGDGIASIEMPSLDGEFGVRVRHEKGYYRDRGRDYRFKEVKEGRWQPWNPTIDIVFKPIENPIPMFAKNVGQMPNPIELPIKNKPIGFDLIKGDWVVPYGVGNTPDIVFSLVEEVPFVSADKVFSSILKIQFSNPLDGIQSVLSPLNGESAMRLPRFAPEDGYRGKLEKRFGRFAEGIRIESAIQEDQNYFIRVRSIVDEKGRIVSANYGKIIGDISCDVINSKTGYIQFSYCLNPTSLDRNMEFDPGRNLFTNLTWGQGVLVP